MISTDVAIVGGGVMGLLSARELSARGLRVTVLDRGPMAAEASWAGGGIVSPLYPWRYGAAVTALVADSQRAYRQLAPELAERTGIDPELRCKGLLMLGVEDSAAALAWAATSGAPMSIESADFVRSLEPHIALTETPRLWMPEICSIRNPRLGQALRCSLELDPRVQLRAECPVTGLVTERGRISALETAAGRLVADRYLICSGAWSAGLLTGVQHTLPVEPVKGQMMLFNTPGGLLDRVVLSGGRYLIPRSDGRILVGSTLEREGFDKRTTEAAYRSLHASALEILPVLADQPVEAQWAGLRPGSPGGVPFIGVVPGYDNLFVNAGHFRNGLVLAPASCRLAAQLLCGEPPTINPTPYAFDAPRSSELL